MPPSSNTRNKSSPSREKRKPHPNPRYTNNDEAAPTKRIIPPPKKNKFITSGPKQPPKARKVPLAKSSKAPAKRSDANMVCIRHLLLFVLLIPIPHLPTTYHLLTLPIQFIFRSYPTFQEDPDLEKEPGSPFNDQPTCQSILFQSMAAAAVMRQSLAGQPGTPTGTDQEIMPSSEQQPSTAVVGTSLADGGKLSGTGSPGSGESSDDSDDSDFAAKDAENKMKCQVRPNRRIFNFFVPMNSATLANHPLSPGPFHRRKETSTAHLLSTTIWKTMPNRSNP
jgi:hypothetical protein